MKIDWTGDYKITDYCMCTKSYNLSYNLAYAWRCKKWKEETSIVSGNVIHLYNQLIVAHEYVITLVYLTHANVRNLTAAISL